MLLLELGQVSYQRAWRLQHRLVKARQEGRVDDVLVLVEHDPVITLGRAADRGHVVASAMQLQEAGIRVHRVERGGDVTYHGPGQLVGYPILSLQARNLGVSAYMHALEEVMIRTLRGFGLEAQTKTGMIGVWIDQRKIGVLGARVEKGITYHGFALHVAPDLNHFAFIVPCGLTGTKVTSMKQELGYPISIQHVRRRLVHHFGQVLDATLQPTSIQQLTC